MLRVVFGQAERILREDDIGAAEDTDDDFFAVDGRQDRKAHVDLPGRR